MEGEMAQDEARNILRLAELEEADQVKATVDADPLSFRWAVPLS
jgi:hypothetical protein